MIRYIILNVRSILDLNDIKILKAIYLCRDRNFVFGMRSVFILLGIFYLFITSSCAPEDDCIGCNMNPKVKIEFEPEFTFELKDSLYTEVKTEIQKLVDSLEVQLSNDQITAIENALVDLRADSLTLAEAYTTLRSGKVQINEIMAPGSNGLEQFTDSLISTFALPVDMQSDTSTFYISYHEFNDTLQLYYTRSIIQNLDGVRMQISNIGVNEEVTTFDSLRVKCGNSSCSNDQTTIFIYF